MKKRAFEPIRRMLNENNSHDLPEKEMWILNKLLPKGSTVIDVGANIGYYCFYFEEISHCATIYAFEPIPSLYKNVKKWFPNIHLYPYAISDKNATAEIKIPYINKVKKETRAKLDDISEKDETGYKSIQIETKSLDHFLGTKLSELHLIKIDIEGHENAAIIGAKQLIEQFEPLIMVEIEARHHGGTINDSISLIHSLNYSITYFDLDLNRFVLVEKFNAEELQKESETNRHQYINNFICFKNGKTSIAELNSLVK